LTDLSYRTLTGAEFALLCAFSCSACGPAVDGGPPDPDPEAEEVRLICDRDYLPAVTELVESAEEQLSIVQWEFFSGEATSAVLSLLGSAADRGVHVEVLLDDHIEENADAIQWMVDRGIDARIDFDEDVRLHAKMLAADSGMLLLGSTNWSNASIRRNRECNLLAQRPQSAQYLRSWFEGLLEDPGDRDPPPLPQDEDEDFSVVVDDALLDRLLEQMDGARQRIDFTMYATFLQPSNLSAPAMQVFSALTAAAERGVAVRGIADWSDWNHSNNDSNLDAVQWLRARGVDIRWEDAEVTTHAKVFRIDDSVQVQSANISSSGFRWNREVGAWTAHHSVLEDIDRWFEDLWAASTLETPDR
jgi:phosphatidylserine/phosphatidylglycerophosphate/cardiolipin synthase-like enzyme